MRRFTKYVRTTLSIVAVPKQSIGHEKIYEIHPNYFIYRSGTKTVVEVKFILKTGTELNFGMKIKFGGKIKSEVK